MPGSDNESQGTPPSSPLETDYKKDLEKKQNDVKWVCPIALFFWFLVFAGGAVIETLPSRIAIGPLSAIDKVAIEQLRSVSSAVAFESKASRMDGGKGDDKAVSDASSGNKDTSESQERNRIRDALIQWSYKMDLGTQFKHFLLCFLFYTPINLAILAFLSGLVGGYFANFYVYSRDLAKLEWARVPKETKILLQESVGDDPAKKQGEEKKGPMEEIAQERRLFLEEPPLTSAIRGFISYVWFISGLYVFGQQFTDTSTSEYLKIAGMVSAVAFAFGYDPTRINQLIGLLPGAKSNNSIPTKV